jgi:S1-C subfamily serine protease
MITTRHLTPKFMYTNRFDTVTRFESWLKPWMFYFLVFLFLILNWFVWFQWKSGTDGYHPDVIAVLEKERDQLKSLLERICSTDGKARVSPDQNSTPFGEDTGLVGMMEASVVLVTTNKGFGTGFFIDANTIVTNHHVINGTEKSSIAVSNKTLGQRISANVVATSTSGGADFALLRISQSPPNIKPLAIGSKPASLQRVIAVGFPGSGIELDANQNFPSHIFTSGDISAVQPQPSGVDFVSHTADISGGNSGGPLVDRCGSVMGVNTFVKKDDSKFESRRLYALSADSLRKFLDANSQAYTSAAVCQIKPAN